MIIEALITGVLSITGWVIGLLPSGTPWTPNLSPVNGLLNQVAGLNTEFPIAETLALLGVVIVIHNAHTLWRLFNWVWETVKP